MPLHGFPRADKLRQGENATRTTEKCQRNAYYNGNVTRTTVRVKM